MKKKKEVERPDSGISTDKKTVVPALESLKLSPGWKILREVLESNIKKIETTILEADDDWTPQKLSRYRDMRYFEKMLLGLPDKIIASYEVEQVPKENIELDPYKEVDNNR